MKLHRTLLLISAAATLLALGAPVHAQTPVAASESCAMVARATVGGSGSAAGALYVAERAIVGMAAHTLPAKSTDYHLLGGLTWIPAELSAGEPVLLGLVPGGGDSDGGVPARVLGFNLEDPAGVPTVLVAGQPATSVVESSNTALDVVTPPGENTFGNPLGSVNVRVLSSLGTHNLDDAYVYLPALTQESPARVGETFLVGYDAGQPAFHMLVYGGTIPGVAVPIPPLEGALEILSPMIVLTGLLHAPAGTASYVLPVPNDPGLVGFLIELQDSALTSLAPLAGSFTNRLTVTVGP